jgi:hypothetical protein
MLDTSVSRRVGGSFGYSCEREAVSFVFMGVATARGGLWYATSVKNMLDRQTRRNSGRHVGISIPLRLSEVLRAVIAVVFPRATDAPRGKSD